MVSAEQPDHDSVLNPGRVFIRPGSPTHTSSGRLSDAGCSLTRRSRVRRVNSRRDDDSSSDALSTTGDISSSQLFVKISATDTRQRSGTATTDYGQPFERPEPEDLYSIAASEENMHQTRRMGRHRTYSTGASASRPAIDVDRGRETCSESGQLRRAQRPRGLSLPRQAFRTGSPSDSSEQPSPSTPYNDVPPVPIFASNRRFRHQPQDSGATQQSTASSSLYPKSTSTDDSCPSLPSIISDDMDDRHIITVNPDDNPHIHELHEMDADDVSYRLRLLMQNNYYLPPAHSKPFNEYTLDAPKKSPAKATSPTFLDLFKVGKKKNVISDQKAGKPSTGPILRTTSDSPTASGLLSPSGAHPNQATSNQPANSHQVRPEAKKGRVVVVRERMEDIRSVAKQVERDLKIREVERRRNVSGSSPSEDLHGSIVDPTESVDLPLSSQESVLHRTGVGTPVDAAVLADHLPPSSPGIWSLDSEEEAWRKAILHAAVGHSLNNSPIATPARSSPSSKPFLGNEGSMSQVSTIPHTSSVSSSSSKAVNLIAIPENVMANGSSSPSQEASKAMVDVRSIDRRKRDLGQRILVHMLEEVEGKTDVKRSFDDRPDVPAVQIEQGGSDMNNRCNHPHLGTSATIDPVRSETPTAPTTPLQPAPRRPSALQLADPSRSSDDLQSNELTPKDESGQLEVRSAKGRLSDAFGMQTINDCAFEDLTPPGSKHPSLVMSERPELLRTVSIAESIANDSHYSGDDRDDDDTFHTPAENVSNSTFPSLRPSLSPMPRTSSEYSQPSPTTSAFHDARAQSPYYGHSPVRSFVSVVGRTSRVSSLASNNDSRLETVSPPPRVSSSLAHAALHPAPRHGRGDSRHRFRTTFDSVSECGSMDDERHAQSNRMLSPISAAMLMGDSPGSYPATPISFFDAFEMQSRVDEADETSTEGDDDAMATAEGGEYRTEVPRMVASDTLVNASYTYTGDERQAIGPFMQHRNASSPQLSSGSSQSYGTAPAFDSRDQLGTTRDLPPLVDLGKLPLQSESSAGRDALNAPAPGASMAKRPSSASSRVEKRPWIAETQGAYANVEEWREEQSRLDQSVRRLDGMLIEHMEREKEVLRRITTTLARN